MFSQVVLIILLILIAKGWALSTSQITQQQLFAILASLLMLGYVTMYVWDQVGRDPASTLYMYESVPGIFLLLFRLGAMAWFVISLKQSFLVETQENKKRFY